MEVVENESRSRNWVLPPPSWKVLRSGLWSPILGDPDVGEPVPRAMAPRLVARKARYPAMARRTTPHETTVAMMMVLLLSLEETLPVAEVEPDPSEAKLAPLPLRLVA